VPISLQASIELSINALPQAWIREAFSQLAVFAPKPADFAREAVVDVWNMSDEQADEGLRVLCQRGLLEISSEGRFTIHQVLSELASVRLGDGREEFRRHFAHYRAITNQGPSARLQLIGELQQIRRAWAWAANTPTLSAALADLLATLSDVLFYTGRIDEAAAAAQQGMDLARSSGAAVELVLAAGSMMAALRARGHVAEATTLLSELENDAVVCAATGIDAVQVTARLGLLRAGLLRVGAKLDQGIEKIDAVIELLERHPNIDAHLEASAFRDRGALKRLRGDTEAAERDLSRALAAYTRVGDIEAQAVTRSYLALVHWATGDLELAQRDTQLTINEYERLGAGWPLTREIGNLGLVYLARGLLDEALDAIARQFTRAAALGDAVEVSRATGNRGIVELHLGHYELAREDLESDLEFVRTQVPQELVCTYANLSRCYARLGRAEDARQAAEVAYELADASGAIPLLCVALQALAEHRNGRQQRALLRKALQLARRHGRRLDEAGCLRALAAIEPRSHVRTDRWALAAETLQSIGASAWLQSSPSPTNPRFLPLLV
jgi:tetratricopeptide (TPR) repeat protein